MHKQRLMEKLGEALAGHGFTCTQKAALEGRSGGLYTVPMLAEGSERAVVFEATEEMPVTAPTVEALRNIAADVGADTAVLCHVGRVEDGAKRACEERVVLWDMDIMARLVGGAQLAECTGTSPPEPTWDLPTDVPLVSSLHDLMPAAFSEPEPAPAMDLDALETLDWEPGAVSEALRSEDADAADDLAEGTDDPFQFPAFDDMLADEDPFAGLDDVAPPGVPRLPMHVSPDEATKAAQERLFAVDTVDMVLQPVHLFDYACELLTDGSLKFDTVEGRLEVHGRSKEVTEVDRDDVDAAATSRVHDVPDLPVDTRTMRTREETAREVATQHIMHRHTRTVEVNVHDEEADVEMVERRAVAPRADNIELRHLGEHHRVLWRLRGPNGSVHVDAMTGVFVEESLRSPDPGTVTLD